MMAVPGVMNRSSRVLFLTYCIVAAEAVAQGYPQKPITFIVGFPPGGGADIVARTIGQKLSENWGQPVVVNNRPGADSSIAYELASQAAPDGYTILMVTTEFAINPSLYKLAYDTTRDFAPLTPAASAPYVLVVHPSVPATSVKQLIALAKSKPGALSYASSGTGVHLASEMFKTMARVDILRVPYKGGPQAVSDVIAGYVSVMFPSMPTGFPHVKTGKVRALAIAGSQRSPAAPDLPTIEESGLAGYEASQWWGVVTRSGTPAEIIWRLNSELVKILGTQDVRERLARQGVEARGSSPEQFAAFVQAEIAKWARVVRESGARVN